MTLGKLNHLIDVLKKKTRLDQKTGELLSEKFEPWHRKMPAQRVDVSGGRGLRGLQVNEHANAVFTIRFIKDIDRTMRIGEGGKEFEILDILDLDGKSMWLQIVVSEVAA